MKLSIIIERYISIIVDIYIYIYMEISRLSGIPAELIAAMHYRENATDIISYGHFIADGVFDPYANPGANVGIFPILLRLLDLYI